MRNIATLLLLDRGGVIEAAGEDDTEEAGEGDSEAAISLFFLRRLWIGGIGLLRTAPRGKILLFIYYTQLFFVKF